MEIDSRNIVIQEEQRKLSFENVVSISDLESASRHKLRVGLSLRAFASVGGRRLTNRHPTALF